MGFRVAFGPPYDPRGNYAHTLYAPYVRDAYLHGARSIPPAVTRIVPFKQFLLATRILNHDRYADTYRYALSTLEGYGTPPERDLVLLVPRPQGETSLADWIDASPTHGGACGAFADLSAGHAVIDGERVIDYFSEEPDEDSGAAFRSMVMRPYALFLLAADVPQANGVTRDGWLRTHWAVMQNAGLFPTLNMETHPLEMWGDLFAMYYSSSVRTQAELDHDWGSVPGLLASLMTE